MLRSESDDAAFHFSSRAPIYVEIGCVMASGLLPAHPEQTTLLLIFAALVPAGVLKVEAPTKLVDPWPPAAGACRKNKTNLATPLFPVMSNNLQLTPQFW